MIKFGHLELNTSQPDDLDAKLVAATGCSSAEVELLLGAGPDRIARALRPFLNAEAPDQSTVARAVANDQAAAIEGIRKLYAARSASTATPAASKSDAKA